MREAIDHFVQSSGYGVTVPIGIAVLLLTFALARQWVEGRVLTGALVFGAAAYAGLFAWALHWTSKTNADMTLRTEAPGLRDKLSQAGDVKIYGAGTSDAKLIYYLEKPVTEFRDIADEASEPASRVLVSSRDDIKKLDAYYGTQLSEDLDPADDNEYFVVPLSAGTEWPAVVKAAIAKHQKK
jgi:hypothetical protein